jgi:GAF domain-containing protein
MSAEQSSHGRALAEAFVGLADTLVADYDVIDLLHRLTSGSVELLPVDAAGLMLSDQRGELQVVSSSTEQAHLVELVQLQADEGPCLDCFRTSRQIAVADLTGGVRWPRFAPQALAAGYRAVHALPLRLRSETIGVLNLFRGEPGTLVPDDLRIGQALADVATIGILQQRAIRHQEILAEQLQAALNSRVVIEQAKGVLAERRGLDMAAAFELLRSHARSTNRRLGELARDVVEGHAIEEALRRDV